MVSRVGERSSARCWRSTSKRSRGLGDGRLHPVDLQLALGEAGVQHDGGQHQHDDDAAEEEGGVDRQRVAWARAQSRGSRRTGRRRRAGATADDRGHAARRPCGAASRPSASPAPSASSGATRSATRRRAEAARGLASRSSADGRLAIAADEAHGLHGAAHAGQVGRAVARARRLAEALLDDAVLAGVVREHGDAPAGRGRLDRRVERRRQGVELAVDLDADRLERARRRVAAGAPGRRGDGRRHDRRQLDRRLDRAGGDDRPGDARRRSARRRSAG